MSNKQRVIGVDLGQFHDHTAIAVVEVTQDMAGLTTAERRHLSYSAIAVVEVTQDMAGLTTAERRHLSYSLQKLLTLPRKIPRRQARQLPPAAVATFGSLICHSMPVTVRKPSSSSQTVASTSRS